MRTVHGVCDDRERWVLGTSYHEAMEDHLGVTLIWSGRHRYRQWIKLQKQVGQDAGMHECATSVFE